MKLLGWRKFIVVTLAMVLSFILALLMKLTAEFSTVISVCVGAFVAGNAVEYAKPMKRDDHVS